jgi:hypothetical protein
MKPDQFRRLALALPEVVEGAHHDHPDFRAHGRVFASLHPDGAQAMVKVPPDVQQRLVAAGVGKPASGAWGRAGCTMVVLADADAVAVREALTEAWQFAAATVAKKGTRNVAKKPAPKRRSR